MLHRVYDVAFPHAVMTHSQRRLLVCRCAHGTHNIEVEIC